MSALPLVAILIIGIIYLDFSIWYSSEVDRIWYNKKWKFRGLLAKFWDCIGK